MKTALLSMVAVLIVSGCANNPKTTVPAVRSAAVGVQIDALDKSLPEIKASATEIKDSTDRQATLLEQLTEILKKL